MIEIRPLQSDDAAGIGALFKRSFGPDRSQQWGAWRYFETPYGVVPGAVAVTGGRIVASYTAWPTPMSIGGQPVKGAQSMDTMTDPDYRGQGLFTKLALACYDMMAVDGFEVLYGFPNENSYNGFIHRLNWDHTGNIPQWKRLLPPARLTPRPLAGAVRRAWGVLHPLANASGKQVDESATAPADLETLFASATTEKNREICQVLRDRPWLEWRYSPASDRGYVWVSVRQAGKLEALLVYHRSERRLTITEMIGGGEALSVGIRHLVAKADPFRLVTVATLTSDRGSIDVLRANGFMQRGNQKFIVKSLTTRLLPGNIHNHDAWRVFGGDFDAA